MNMLYSFADSAGIKIVKNLLVAIMLAGLFACGSEVKTGSGLVTVTGIAGTGASQDKAVLKPFSPGKPRYGIFPNNPIEFGTVEFYYKDGTLLATAKTDETGKFSIDTLIGKDTFIKVTSFDGTTVARKYVPLINSGGISDVVVNAHSSAVVYVMENHLGVKFTEHNKGYTGPVLLSEIEAKIQSDSNLSVLATAVQQDMQAGNSDGLSENSKNVLDSINVDTERPLNTTGNNFIENGDATTNKRQVQLTVSASDDNGVFAYYLSEFSATPRTTDAGWQPLAQATSLSTFVMYNLSEGDGNKRINIWFIDKGGNISEAATDTIELIESDDAVVDDDVPPEITVTSPVDRKTLVDVNTVISITFSKPMDTASVEEAWNMDPVLDGTFSWGGGNTILTFTPAEDFAPDETHIITLTTTAKDSSGISLASQNTFMFRTGQGEDTTQPHIATIIPADGNSGVAVNAVVAVTFSEQINTASITEDTFYVSSFEGKIEGKFDYLGQTGTFVPDIPFEYSTSYTITVTPGIIDMAGNTLLEGRTWEFTTIPDTISIVGISAGGFHTCATLRDGTAKCWGYNEYGQLGIGTDTSRGDEPDEMGDNLPSVMIGEGKIIRSITAGGYHTCALTDTGIVKCWGANESGQLGLGSSSSIGTIEATLGFDLEAVQLGTSTSALLLAAGYNHTCAILDGGSVKCWGWNSNGQLGLGHLFNRGDSPGEMKDALIPVALGKNLSASQIIPGHFNTCAIIGDTDLKCWGWNSRGQLGLGDTLTRGDSSTNKVPDEMGDLLPFVSLPENKTFDTVSVGGSHICAILNDGSVRCWGWNNSGQLGLGSRDILGDEPDETVDKLPAVDLGTDRIAKKIAAGENFTCAILDNGSVKCWGKNESGQLGLGDTASRGDDPDEMGDNLPVVNLGTDKIAMEIDAGMSHICASLNDGTMKCWGNNKHGQLGLGDNLSRGDNPNEMGDNLPIIDPGIGSIGGGS